MEIWAAEKNITFAIDVFYSFHKIQPKSKYLIVGDGPQKEFLQEKIRKLKLEKSIIILGRSDKVWEILQALDIFIMPSLYEGFGIAALEAAASGLPIFLSDNIPKDFGFYDKAYYLPLSSGSDYWAEFISCNFINRNRENCFLEVIDAGFDLDESKKQIEEIYRL